MAEIEKYNPIRINKDTAPDAIERGGDRKFLPGELLDAENCRYTDSTSGKTGVLKNTPGNLLKSVSLPSGANKVIGSFLYEKENTIIYILHNSTGNHRYIEWNPDTNTFTTLLQGSSLNLNVDFPVCQGKTLDDILITNDRYNRPRKFNIKRARAGEYIAPYQEYAISLAVKPPIDPPVVALIDDTVALISLIYDDTWQFSARFIYNDNEQSAIGPYSKLVWPGFNIDPIVTTKRAIQVTVNLPAALVGLVSKVQFLARRGNNGIFFIFYTASNITDPAVTAVFRNNENQYSLSASEEAKIYDQIPDRTEALEIIESRAFLSLNNFGFDENRTATLTTSLESEAMTANPVVKKFAKEGGIYSVGIVYVDDFGKTSFVENAQTLNVPFTLNNNRNAIRWILSGTPPAYAKRYQIVLSRDRFYSTYFQCRPVVHLYVSEITTSAIDNTQTADSYNYKSRLFRKLENIVNDRVLRYNLVYLQLPTNIPFLPDSTCFVRFISPLWPVGTKTVYPVLDYVGGFLVVDARLKVAGPIDPRQEPDNFIDYRLFPNILIEVFQQNEQQDQRYFEVSEVYNVVNGNFEVGTGKIYGDTYELSVPYLYDPINVEGAALTQKVPTINDDKYESPSGILSSVFLSVPTANYNKSRPTRAENAEVASTTTTVLKKVVTLDYNKTSGDYGRAHIEQKAAKKKDFFNLIGFSDPYIQNTEVNGLSSFYASNTYPIPVERTPTRSLKKANNILISIHERNATSLYIGEGILRQGVDFLMAKVDRVVGDDRNLSGGWGTINPESVKEYNGDLYWWDGLKGAVIRYTNAGMFPISLYGMESYFLKKSKDYFPYRNSIKVLTCVDPSNDEFLITLPTVVVNNVPIIQGVTWAFKIKEKIWVTRYSFLPEYYQSSSLDLISFKDGQLWLHNVNPVHNNFYGIQYQRKIRYVSNPALGREKKYLNIHLDGQIAVSMTDETFVPIRIYAADGQETFIPIYEFELDGGKWNAPVLKNINSPVESGQHALNSGEDIVSNYIEIEVSNNRVDQAPTTHMNVVYKEEKFSI